MHLSWQCPDVLVADQASDPALYWFQLRELGSHSCLWSLFIEGTLTLLSEGIRLGETGSLAILQLKKLKFYCLHRGEISGSFKIHIMYI